MAIILWKTKVHVDSRHVVIVSPGNSWEKMFFLIKKVTRRKIKYSYSN